MREAHEARVVDNPDQSRYDVFLGDELAGFAVYRREADVVTFTHTEIDDAFEGKGLGSRLASAALDDVRSAGLLVRPQCPFIARYISRHPDYEDLVTA